jgi:hypothetical protein
MAENELKVGDVVRIAPHDNWKQPVRGWAERQRLATVESTHPNGTATIRFNNARNKAFWNVEMFKAYDLNVVAPAP